MLAVKCDEQMKLNEASNSRSKHDDRDEGSAGDDRFKVEM